MNVNDSQFPMSISDNNIDIQLGGHEYIANSDSKYGHLRVYDTRIKNVEVFSDPYMTFIRLTLTNVWKDKTEITLYDATIDTLIEALQSARKEN